MKISTILIFIQGCLFGVVAGKYTGGITSPWFWILVIANALLIVGYSEMKASEK